MKDLDPMKLRGAECFAWAILNPGFKIHLENQGGYIFYEKSYSRWLDEASILRGLDTFEPYADWIPYVEPKPEPELVTWYRPKVYWLPNSKYLTNGDYWYRTKEEFFKGEFECKVLEWEEIQAPATYDEVDCND